MEKTIRNRDIPRLASLPSLLEATKNAAYKRRMAQDRLWKITHGDLDFERATRPEYAEKQLNRAYDTLSELEAEYASACDEYASKARETEDLLKSIQDDNLRTFVEMMYVHREKYCDIQKKLYLSRKVFDRLRRIVEDAPSMAEVNWPGMWL